MCILGWARYLRQQVQHTQSPLTRDFLWQLQLLYIVRMSDHDRLRAN